MQHLLPPLPYSSASLEPHIDARTMTLHHDKHHASYVANLNAALEEFPELHERTALWLLLNLGQVPEQARTAVRNNAGGHVNHSMLWRAMTPVAGGSPAGPARARRTRETVIWRANASSCRRDRARPVPPMAPPRMPMQDPNS